MDPLATPESFGVRADLARSLADLALSKPGVTVLLAVGILLLRWAAIRLIRGQADYVSDERRRWIAVVRNGSLLVLIGIVGVLWLPEARDFALSLAAVALAVVIATKELLLCLTGALLRAISGAFQTSDWIEVGDVSGEVYEQTFLSTTLLEVNPRRYEYTGRTITLPNSVFLTSRVINHGFRKRFVFHEFVVYAEPLPHAEAVRAHLERRLAEAAAEFEELAARYASVIEKRVGVRLPGTAPRVRLGTTDLAKLAFEATLFCPRERALDLEAVAASALAEWQDSTRPDAPAAPYRPAATSSADPAPAP
ncbi:MAG: mechanosensitive ion channel [Paracoccaceae bacterium]